MDYYKLFYFSGCSNIVSNTVYLQLNINKEIHLETKCEVKTTESNSIQFKIELKYYYAVMDNHNN